jgi:hypothetical protein
MGMVLFKDLVAAESVGQSIIALQKTLDIYPGFKFNKDCMKAKEIFLDTVCHYDFEVRAIIVDKAGMIEPAFRKDSQSFYAYLVKSLLESNLDLLSDVSWKVNSQVDRKLKTILAEQIKARGLKKFKFCDYQADALIQLANMCIGVIAKNYTDESACSYQLFNKLVETNKIKSIWKLR